MWELQVPVDSDCADCKGDGGNCADMDDCRNFNSYNVGVVTVTIILEGMNPQSETNIHSLNLTWYKLIFCNKVALNNVNKQTYMVW